MWRGLFVVARGCTRPLHQRSATCGRNMLPFIRWGETTESDITVGGLETTMRR
jgi:hypothetical protein